MVAVPAVYLVEASQGGGVEGEGVEVKAAAGGASGPGAFGRRTIEIQVPAAKTKTALLLAALLAACCLPLAAHTRTAENSPLGLGASVTSGHRAVPAGNLHNALRISPELRQTRIRSRCSAKLRDYESGLNLDYFGARYYAGAMGRFASADKPFNDQFEADPQSWNLYSYVRNNPLRFIDPTGRCKEGADGRFHDSDEGPCVAEGGTTVTVGITSDERRWLELVWAGQLMSNRNLAEVGVRGITGAAMVEGGVGALRGGLGLMRGLGGVLRQPEAIAGLYGSISRVALESAATGGGPTVTVVTRLTQAPETGRALSVAVGEGAGALASAARSEGTLYVAHIPKALMSMMESAGLVSRSTTQMGGAAATELRFLPNATEFVVNLFKPVR